VQRERHPGETTIVLTQHLDGVVESSGPVESAEHPRDRVGLASQIVGRGFVGNGRSVGHGR
jgi:hypothetical protein